MALFEPGRSGNPGGRPALPAELKLFRTTTYKDFLSALQRYGQMSKTEIQAELHRADATMFEIMFANLVVSAAKGDKDARKELLERLWGKVKDSIELTKAEADDILDLVDPEQLVLLLREG